MRKSDGKLHRERSANKNLFRSGTKTKKRLSKALGWFFGKSGEKRYIISSPIIVHSKGK